MHSLFSLRSSLSASRTNQPVISPFTQPKSLLLFGTVSCYDDRESNSSEKRGSWALHDCNVLLSSALIVDCFSYVLRADKNSCNVRHSSKHIHHRDPNAYIRTPPSPHPTPLSKLLTQFRQLKRPDEKGHTMKPLSSSILLMTWM